MGKYSDGYQDALRHVATQYDQGGGDAVMEWVRNNLIIEVAEVETLTPKVTREQAEAALRQMGRELDGARIELTRNTYRVYRADGTEVRRGDPMGPDFRGDDEGDLFHGAYHPRKIAVRIPWDDWFAQDGYKIREYGPSVYNVEIRASNGTVWNPVSEVGRTMPANMER